MSGVDQQCLLASELRGHESMLMEDQHGNHVLQKLIEHTKPPEKVQFLVDVVHRNVMRFVTHCFGCRVVQRIFEHGSEAQKHPLMDMINPKIYELILDQYVKLLIFAFFLTILMNEPTILLQVFLFPALRSLE